MAGIDTELYGAMATDSGIPTRILFALNPRFVFLSEHRMNCFSRRGVLCLLAVYLMPGQLFADDWSDRKAKFNVSDEHQQAIEAAVPKAATAKPKQARKVLVFYPCGGFIHSSIPHANHALTKLGEHTGAFAVDLTDSYDVFSNENLAKYDGIILNNTTMMQFPTPAHQNAFLDFVAGGKGLAGIHAASDNFRRDPEARAIVGGQFNGHPWGAGGTWAFKVDDPEHVLNKAFGGKGFWHQDEIYQYDPESYVGTGVLRILLSLDMSKEKVSSRIKDGPREVPVSWLRKAGDGRVFYTNLGHREETFRNPVMLQHMLDGIQYALGDLEADATPTDLTDKTTPSLAPESP